jgi:hypothetical protein
MKPAARGDGFDKLTENGGFFELGHTNPFWVSPSNPDHTLARASTRASRQRIPRVTESGVFLSRDTPNPFWVSLSNLDRTLTRAEG